MPRRNENYVHDRVKRPKRRKPAIRQAGVDWDRVNAQHRGDDPDQRDYSWTTRTSREKPHNEFVRHLTGFSDDALAFMLERGLEHVDEAGFVAVTFTGISQKPTKEYAYKKPTAVKTKAGLLVVSGVVEGAGRSEIGEESSITQADAPIVDGYDSPGRLNLALGQAPEFDVDGLSRKLAVGDPLVLSAVASVNGHAIRDAYDAGRFQKPTR